MRLSHPACGGDGGRVVPFVIETTRAPTDMLMSGKSRQGKTWIPFEWGTLATSASEPKVYSDTCYHTHTHTHTHTRKAQEQHGETLWLTQLNALLEEAETKRMRRKMANTDLFMLSKDKPSRRRPERRKASHVKRTET